ncbi:MAG: NTP transferase domain-containing protein [Coriobacteriia bacterium]|nr:NTP transferase domain-containing protein [Coriobacteriia bacterium]
MGSIAAIILAAGYSSRMGAFKPLLPFGETTVLEQAVAVFRKAGVQDVRVVVGYRSEDLLPVLAGMKVRSVMNPCYQEGMFSSVLAGVESMGAECEAFFLMPVDFPLVRPETIELLAHARRDTSIGIFYPAFLGERGHPPLISNSYRERLLSWRGMGGLKAFLEQYEGDSMTVESGDEGILLDMDTLEDYERLRASLRVDSTPSRQVCEQLLCGRFAADSPVVEHCRAVARLALVLAERLNECGCRLDTAVVEAGALLHDLARDEPDHAAAGAAALTRMGHRAVADVVATHMDIQLDPGDAINAAELVFLADKLTRGTRYVPLEVRFRDQLERHAHEDDVLAKITCRLESARMIAKGVESRLGRRIEDVWTEATP